MQSDLKEKTGRVAGVLVSMYVAPPPGKPNLNANASCQNTFPEVTLDWDDTSDTDYYDVYRDGSILVSNLTSSSYIDNSVNNETSYSYYVIAFGPMGETQSDTVSTTTEDCPSKIPPEINIISFQGKTLTSYHGTPETKDRTPEFSGTSTIPNAQIEIYVSGSPAIFSSTSANINGYWSWVSPQKLDYGTHLISMIAADPLDPTRTAQTSLQFKIKKEDEEEDESEEETETGQPSPPVQPLTPEKPGSPANPEEKYRLSTFIVNPGKTAYPGENILTNTTFRADKKNFSEEGLVTYEIIDEKNSLVLQFEKKEILSSQKDFSFSMRLPENIATGSYKLRVSIPLEKENVFLLAEDFFQVKDRPILSVGRLEITAPQMANYLVWTWMFLLLFLLLYLILLLVEHHLSKKARFHISENDLRSGGYI